MKVYFFILFFCFIVLFLPLTVTAAPPAIDLNVSSTNINPGESILLDITVESNYRLSGNSVKIIWGEPGGTSVPCTMSVDYAAPPQTCNTSAWHTYNTEGDYTIQVTACSLLGCGIKKIDIHVDSAAPTPTPVDSYRNPLVWSDIPGFIWGAIMYIFGHAIVLPISLERYSWFYLGSYYVYLWPCYSSSCLVYSNWRLCFNNFWWEYSKN